MSRYRLIDMFKNESAETFNKCSKAYELGRTDERSHIVEILFGIDRQVAELVKEILNNEKVHK